MAREHIAEPKIHLTLAQYQERATAANQFKGAPEAIDQLRFGFFGEVGGLLSGVKKSHRDLGPAEKANVREELGDALWYLTTVTAEYGLRLEDVGTLALTELQRRFGLGHRHKTDRLTFHEFDGLLAFCHTQLTTMSVSQHLCQLASHAGQLLSRAKEQDLVNHPPLELIGTLLADMVTVGALFDVTIADITKENLRKFESRWPASDAPYHPLFDSDRPSIEQLPREFSIRFIQRLTPDEKPYVVQQLNGVNIGDRLTDNRTQADGYRFHDVFHLAYVAHLGWSPVVRGLLKLKRKGDPDLDENQDGARAMIIEEGIATWIFNHADRRNFFEKTTTGKLEYGLLKQVLDMVDGYEVSSCPLWQWERAILDGFKVFRELRSAGGGIVHVNMNAHTIAFEALTEEPQKDAPRRKISVMVGAAFPPRLKNAQ
jgi:NTP pyrophosphatase (non-canonical NTP hydrolase)